MVHDMSKLTPGPWIASDYDATYIEIDSVSGEQVGEAYNPADARIMAAAPEVVRAIEDFLDCLQGEVIARGHSHAVSIRDAYPVELRALEAALNKAHGNE